MTKKILIAFGLLFIGSFASLAYDPPPDCPSCAPPTSGGGGGN